MFENVSPGLVEYIKDIPIEIRDLKYLIAANAVCKKYLGKSFMPEGDDGTVAKITNDPWGPKHRAMVEMVGSTIFELRSSPCISEFCRRLRTRDLRSSFFEMFSARNFNRANFKINASPELGIKGLDFDYQVTRNGMTMNVEVTALAEQPFSSRTLDNSLEQKRKQLNRDLPSIIFILIPQRWLTEDMNFWTEQCCNTLFRRSHRINAILTMFELTDETDGYFTKLFPLRIFENPSPRHYVDLSFLTESPMTEAQMSEVFQKQKSEFYRWVDVVVP